MSTHEWQEYAAPYALGALAPEERSAFETHLAGCEACRADVRSFAEVAGLLSHGAPSADPPPGVRERVLAEMASVYKGNLIFGEDGMEVPVDVPRAAKLM